MTHHLKKAHPLTKIYFAVIVIFIGAAIVTQVVTDSKPQPEMRKEQTALPQQSLNQGGHKSTVISFQPTSSGAEPIKKTVGDAVSLEMNVDPGQNLVSFMKVEILYDPKKLEPVKNQAFQPEGALSSILDGPLYTKGKISVTMSIGADPTRALGRPENTAIITFKTIAPTTEGTPTLVSIGPDTNVLSLASNDSASENVLANAIPAIITIEAK